MLVAVLLFGAAITLLAILGLASPGKLRNFVSGFGRSRNGFYFAIGIRLVFGIMLIGAASESRFPLGFQVLGFVSLVGAAAVAIIGQVRVQRMGEWANARSDVVIRAWALCAAAFGAFLVYGAM